MLGLLDDPFKTSRVLLQALPSIDRSFGPCDQCLPHPVLNNPHLLLGRLSYDRQSCCALSEYVSAASVVALRPDQSFKASNMACDGARPPMLYCEDTSEKDYRRHDLQWWPGKMRGPAQIPCKPVSGHPHDRRISMSFRRVELGGMFAAIALVATFLPSVAAQQSCTPLRGSSRCPAFNTSYAATNSRLAGYL